LGTDLGDLLFVLLRRLAQGDDIDWRCRKARRGSQVANEHAGKENVGSVDQMAADFNAFLDSNRWDRIRDRQGYDALFVGANNCQELACDTA
jgi:hypothetical protein